MIAVSANAERYARLLKVASDGEGLNAGTLTGICERPAQPDCRPRSKTGPFRRYGLISNRRRDRHRHRRDLTRPHPLGRETACCGHALLGS